MVAILSHMRDPSEAWSWVVGGSLVGEPRQGHRAKQPALIGLGAEMARQLQAMSFALAGSLIDVI